MISLKADHLLHVYNSRTQFANEAVIPPNFLHNMTLAWNYSRPITALLLPATCTSEITSHRNTSRRSYIPTEIVCILRIHGTVGCLSAKFTQLWSNQIPAISTKCEYQSLIKVNYITICSQVQRPSKKTTSKY